MSTSLTGPEVVATWSLGEDGVFKCSLCVVQNHDPIVVPVVAASSESPALWGTVMEAWEESSGHYVAVSRDTSRGIDHGIQAQLVMRQTVDATVLFQRHEKALTARQPDGEQRCRMLVPLCRYDRRRGLFVFDGALCLGPMVARTAGGRLVGLSSKGSDETAWHVLRMFRRGGTVDTGSVLAGMIAAEDQERVVTPSGCEAAHVGDAIPTPHSIPTDKLAGKYPASSAWRTKYYVQISYPIGDEASVEKRLHMDERGNLSAGECDYLFTDLQQVSVGTVTQVRVTVPISADEFHQFIEVPASRGLAPDFSSLRRLLAERSPITEDMKAPLAEPK
jgi:hypothetical protein